MNLRKENAIENSFWMKNFTASETFNQFFSQLIVFRIEIFTTCQILSQHFCQASGFQVELSFLEANSAAKFLFKKNSSTYTSKTSNLAFSLFHEKLSSQRNRIRKTFFIKYFLETNRISNQIITSCTFLQ